MPDLSNKGSHQFWYEYIDPAIYQVISFMEGVENWTIDGNEALEKVMAELGAVLDNIGKVDLQAEDKIMQIACNLKMGRVLRLLHCLDTAHPGAAAKILMYAEANSQEKDNSPSTIFLQRNLVFERLRLFSRIFAKERLNVIAKVMEEAGSHA